MNKEIEKLKANLSNLMANLKQSLRVAFEKLQDIQGNNYQLGLMHLERGNLGDAAFRFMLVTRLNPKFTDAWVKLADAQWQRGSVDKANQALAQAKKLQPDHPEIVALVQRMSASPEQSAT